MIENRVEQQATLADTTAQQKADWLRKKIKESIEDTRRNKKTNQNRASYIKVSIIVLSGAATILLGLQIAGLEESFRNIAFALGATVTLLNALEPFFNFRSLWVEHEVALAGFHRLQDKLEFYLEGVEPTQLSRKEIDKFHDEYQEIWQNFGKAWISYRKSDKEIQS